jgi:hypothetical protein
MRRAIAIVILALSACAGPETTVRLTIVYEDTWGLTEIAVSDGARNDAIDPVHTVVLRLSARRAGAALPISVTGFAGESAIAYGETSVIPIRGEEVEGRVVLERQACDALCEQPRDPICVDESTIRVFHASGTCEGDLCERGFADQPCENCPDCADCVPGWTSEQIDDPVSFVSAIALSDDGTVHIAYASFDGLQYAHRMPADVWSIERIDASADPAMAVAGTEVHVVYRESAEDSRVLHAYRAGAEDWRSSVVAGDPAPVSPAIALDASGAPYVLYLAADGLHLAEPDGSDEWPSENVNESTNADELALVIDALGGFHVAARRPGESALYLHRGPSGGDWTSLPLPAEVTSLALAAADDGTAHAVYTDSAVEHQVHHTMRAPGGGWSEPIVIDATGITRSDVALAVHAGVVHAVRTAPADGIRYMRRTAEGVWSYEDLHRGDESEVAIAAGPAGVHVSYYEWYDVALAHAELRVCP